MHGQSKLAIIGGSQDGRPLSDLGSAREGDVHQVGPDQDPLPAIAVAEAITNPVRPPRPPMMLLTALASPKSMDGH
jgi:hypothetical protein